MTLCERHQRWVLVLTEHLKAFPLSKDINSVSGPVSSPVDVICVTVLELFSFLLLTQEMPQRFAGPTSSRVHRLQCGLGEASKDLNSPPCSSSCQCLSLQKCALFGLLTWGAFIVRIASVGSDCGSPLSMDFLLQPGLLDFLVECSAICSPPWGFASLLVHHQCQFAQPSMREEEMQFSKTTLTLQLV